jgi:hypothetical protein
MMKKYLLATGIALQFGCATVDKKPTDPLVHIGLRIDPLPTIQEWVEYNHYFRSIPLKSQQIEFKQIEKQVSDRDVKENERHKAMFKYVIASYQISPSLPELSKAKSFLAELMRNKQTADREQHFWELYADNLNDSIRFLKLQALVTKKYEDERIARIELEDKIKALSDIEQVADDRTETTK